MGTNGTKPEFGYSREDDGTWTIRGLEVFRSGDYGARGLFSDGRVDDIASRYNPETGHEAPVTVDHQRKGPALGWVRRLQTYGGRLFADINKISDDFFETLRAQQFKKRSIELFEDGHRMAGQFRALTFLGAAPPRVMGMADPIFSDEDGEPVVFDYDAPCLPYVSMPYGPPPEVSVTVARATVLRTERAAHEMLGHRHVVVIDDAGNGWTSPPCFCGPDTPGDDHQHVVIGGIIQPKADKLGNVHIHVLDTLFETKPIETHEATEITIMSDETKVDKAAFDELAEKFEESQATLRRFADDAAARMFTDAVSAANVGGVRITPAAAKKLRAIYDRLREVKEPICFEDGAEHPAHEQLLAIFSDLPVIPATSGKNLDAASTRMAAEGTRLDFSDDPAEAARQRVTMADELKAKGFSDDYEACMIEAERRQKAATA